MDESVKDISCECVEGSKDSEFIDTVNVVLVDPPKMQYYRKKTLSAFIAIATMMQGATVMFVIVLTLTFFLPFYSNLHIYLCTIGYQLCMPSAILMLNDLFGPAAPLRKSDRRFQHSFLQVVAMCCFFYGSYVALFREDKFKDQRTTHYYAGCVAGVSSILAALMGPILFLVKTELYRPSFFTTIHRLFGIIAFLSSSVCFMKSLTYRVNIYWLIGMGKGVPIILIMFSLFYTIVILYTPLVNLIFKNKSVNSDSMELK